MRTPESNSDNISEKSEIVQIETPSGKTEASENFPVGSWLLPSALRPHITKFYRFARAIDDIADHPHTSPDQKILGLEAFEAALEGSQQDDLALKTAHLIRESLKETGITSDHCCNLIKAFKQDAIQNRYRTWDELMAYCGLSAAPVGRYLIDLHGGSNNGYAPSDALCNALQVINHLQDCQEDYRDLDRVYIPLDWMGGQGVEVQELDNKGASPGMRRVFDQMLDETEILLLTATNLPRGIVSNRLAMEAGVIIEIANRLVSELRKRDPLAERVKLSRGAVILCGVRGIIKSTFGLYK